MKYDDASWHYEGDFPPDLPPEAGATHIAMFFCWAVERGLAGALHVEDATTAQDLARLSRRELDPRDYLEKWCDDKLTDEDLSSQGNRFAAAYYEASYFNDLAEVFPDEEVLYRVENSRENYELVFAILDRRFRQWQEES